MGWPRVKCGLWLCGSADGTVDYNADVDVDKPLILTLTLSGVARNLR